MSVKNLNYAIGNRTRDLPGNIPCTHFCYRLSQPQGDSAVGRIMSVKNLNYAIGNRTRDPPGNIPGTHFC